MSWQEKINGPFQITTGDGKTYTPLWLATGKENEYNVAVYEFPEISGSLVKRKLPKGRRHTFEISFQGLDHLDVYAAFELSAADPGRWTVGHPYYGSIYVHPLTMSVDHTQANVSRVVITAIESINENAPVATLSPQDKIIADKGVTDGLLADTWVADVKPKSSDITEMSNNARTSYNIGAKGISDTLDSESYFNAFSDANAAITNAIADPLLAIRQFQAMLNAPYQFLGNVQSRLGILTSQLQNLGKSIQAIITRNSKKLYENNAGTVVGAILAATVTNVSYSTRREAVEVIDIVLDAYNQYLTNLDAIQSDNGGAFDAYIADAASLISLSNLVSYTVSVLIEIATNARQERTFFLEEDTNLFPLAKRLYGLLPDDSTIDELMQVNQIGLNELLIIKKGRPITYYI